MTKALGLLVVLALFASCGAWAVADVRKEPARRAHRTRVVAWAAQRWVAWAYPGQRARFLWRPGLRADVLLPGAPPFTIACERDGYDDERVSCGLAGPSTTAPASAPATPHAVVAHPVVAVGHR